MTTVSILLLCWNHSAYLEQCIAALAAQDRDGVELLFLDNGSSDGSVDQAKALFDRHGLTATILCNAEPKGIAANLNLLLARSAGALVAPLSTDDWYEPGYVAAMRRQAAADPQAGWFACDGYLFFEDSGERAPIRSDDFRGGRVLDDLLDGKNPHNFVGCCYRREALEAVGGWDERLPIEDRDLFVRLAQRYPVSIVERRLVNYRRSSQAASADPAFMARGWAAYFAKHRDLFGPRLARQRAAALQGVAAVAVDRGELLLAARLIRAALLAAPASLPSWRTAAYLLRTMVSARRRSGGAGSAPP
ncbi:glycosyltransferase [Sphingomonas ginkgonis]|uniref:Glycosyltransferase n=1 Tax=Sphingomonas ginkgonis TaxID=2315330 RepID=A0A429V7Y8_9SPHN|nr:glycosyltransferase [Sphingomonas ginkgonis]RST30034.1 glycosyltransferase [Sphingomonas ginkgonis]